MEKKVKRDYIYDDSANLLSLRDPMVVVVGDTYYMTGTQMPHWKGVSDGVSLWSTKDFKQWTCHGLVFARACMPESTWCRDRFWAPEIFDGGDGWFYLTVSARNESEKYKHEFGICLARAKEITGPYELVSKDGPVCEGIDGTIYKEDGKFYLGHTASDGLHLDQFDPSTGKIIKEQVVAQKGKEGEWDSIGIEGQCVVKRHGKYFQWYSSWTHGYHAGLMLADNIEGPWVKHENNPWLKETKYWHTCGHNHSFRALNGKDYITFHAQSPIDPEDPRDLPRIYIREITYNADGTVTINPEEPNFE